MLIPFRTLHLFPEPPLCTQPACLSQILDQPLVVREEVYDVIGIPCAFDLHLTQGFYLLIFSYALVRWVRDAGLRAYFDRRK